MGEATVRAYQQRNTGKGMVQKARIHKGSVLLLETKGKQHQAVKLHNTESKNCKILLTGNS